MIIATGSTAGLLEVAASVGASAFGSGWTYLSGGLGPLLPPPALVHLLEVLPFGAGTDDLGPSGALRARKRRALKIRT